MKLRRRLVLLAATSGAVGLVRPPAARAQPRRPRVAVVFNDPLSNMQGPQPAHHGLRPLLQGLQDRGWRDGVEVDVQRYSTEGRIERMPALMREVAGTAPDVIVTVFVHDALKATTTIPVVGVALGAVETGLTTSLARPDRNFTGMSFQPMPGLNGRRLELLKQAVPTATRVAFLTASPPPGMARFSDATRAAAAALGIDLLSADMDVPTDVEVAFQSVLRQRAQALVVTQTYATFEARHRIAERAAELQLPAMYGERQWVADGGLMAYGNDSVQDWRHLAGHVVRILRGAKPADLPIEHPTRFQLWVNRRALQRLGLVPPPAFLVQVESFIE